EAAPIDRDRLADLAVGLVARGDRQQQRHAGATREAHGVPSLETLLHTASSAAAAADDEVGADGGRSSWKPCRAAMRNGLSSSSDWIGIVGSPGRNPCRTALSWARGPRRYAISVRAAARCLFDTQSPSRLTAG